MSNTSVDFLRSLPDVLKNAPNMAALATAIANELERLAEDVEKAIIYARIDELGEDVLDLLAYDFKVDWWDYTYTVAEKRRILKNSWNVHRHLGTKGAVETAISSIYEGSKVQEWFEYGGDPYKFRLLLDITYDSADPVKHQSVLDRVNFYKNMRSHLETIEYVGYSSSVTSYAIAAAIGTHIIQTATAVNY